MAWVSDSVWPWAPLRDKAATGPAGLLPGLHGLLTYLAFVLVKREEAPSKMAQYSNI